MIRYATEGTTAWFSDILVSDIPYPLVKGIRVHVAQTRVGVEAQGVVGAIPLLNGDTLQIRPKIGQINFLRLLFKAEGSQHTLEKEYDRFVEYFVEDRESIDSIVARQLMVSSSEILARSPKEGRVKRLRRGPFAAGQIDGVATSFNIACRRNEPVVYWRKEKTINIPENRLITEAVVRVWPVLGKEWQDKTRRVYSRWVKKFPRSSDINADLAHVERGFAASKYGGARDYYRKALMLANIVLGSSGLGFIKGKTTQGDAVLLNTANVFEKYLRNTIRDAYARSTYIINKGKLGSLYVNGSFQLHPDIVISKSNQVVLIADAKYKRPTASDHYQLCTYLRSSYCISGLLLSPLYSGSEVTIREYSTADGLLIREIQLPMSNLSATEEFLGTIVQRFAA